MEKQRFEESERRIQEVRRAEKRKSEKKEDAGKRKGRKDAIHCVFQWFVALGGRKVGSLKRRVRSHLARYEIFTNPPFWRTRRWLRLACISQFFIGSKLQADVLFFTGNPCAKLVLTICEGCLYISKTFIPRRFMEEGTSKESIDMDFLRSRGKPTEMAPPKM